MANPPLPIEIEEFLSWMVAEKGRSANTIAAYRRDLTLYGEWLAANSATVLDVNHQQLVDFVANTAREQCCHLVDRTAAGRSADAAPLPVG